MIGPRYFHSKFLFLIPLSQAVLLITVLDFTKNAVFFAKQCKNLSPSTPEYDGTGNIVRYKVKDTAYLMAQYVYIFWLSLMMLKAVMGFRANYVYHFRWMGIYNILLGFDCIFEFVRTNLSAIFTDLTGYTRKEIIRFYCLSYFLLFFQLYSFIFCWLHLRWAQMEMPYLSEGPVSGLWQPRRIEPGGRPPLPGHRRAAQEAEAAAAAAAAVAVAGPQDIEQQSGSSSAVHGAGGATAAAPSVVVESPATTRTPNQSA
ncbi:hypothetical protein DFQ27_000958 [Actinomortierella ambigua]|uniref:Uncharacterized protein n=1 Tax=Actinomortierella ambigua TaxID=1343610 RepID=A0A9P6QBS7_9FUNG|nr:hypothetical protein DFQ27_000958 [Actinomortierella ambigua]